MTDSKDNWFTRFQQRIQNMETPAVGSVFVAACLFVLNFLIPGSGTILGTMWTMNQVEDTNNVTVDLIIGIIQFFTAWLIIGWVWSVLWGFLMLKTEVDEEKRLQKAGDLTPMTPISPA